MLTNSSLRADPLVDLEKSLITPTETDLRNAIQSRTSGDAGPGQPLREVNVFGPEGGERISYAIYSRLYEAREISKLRVASFLTRSRRA